MVRVSGMREFSEWPEATLHWVRWGLLLGWGLLIASLLIPFIPWGQQWSGNRVFWGMVVPAGLLLIVFSHELWRRICPLAFVSQLFRALNWQRTVPGLSGKPEVAKVQPESWLAKHHLQLQWCLLIGGLCLRLLGVNGSPLALFALLVFSGAAAAFFGWFYSGKAWCQYICPMGPVQMILTAQRGALSSPAHVGSRSRITQSMCRTVDETGQEQSACVACQRPCIDIDAEGHYWQQSKQKRGLTWAWYSYPGLVLAFFLLTIWTGADHGRVDWSYLSDGHWAVEVSFRDQVLGAFVDGLQHLPNLIAIPALLTGAGWLSFVLFTAVQRRLMQRHALGGNTDPLKRAVNQTRLLATFIAINTFFLFSAPLQGVLTSLGDRLLGLAVISLTAVGLSRSWLRTEATYRRERTSESLRTQLKGRDDLIQALDGRALDDLLPEEVYTLAKALSVTKGGQAREVYQAVMRDMLRTGRLDSASSLLELEELRDVLGLDVQDHHNALQLLSVEDAALLRLDAADLQQRNLHVEAAREQLQTLMAIAGLDVLDPAKLNDRQRQQLEDLRRDSELNDGDWEVLLNEMAPGSVMAERALEATLQRWTIEAGLLLRLEQQAKQLSLFNPLAMVMRRRLRVLEDALELGLPEVIRQEPERAGALEDALDLLWLDPDPDVAGWVVMVEQTIDPMSPRRAAEGRGSLPSSLFLEQQLSGGDRGRGQLLGLLTATRLFEDLVPDQLLWLENHSAVKAWTADERLLERGERSDELLIVVDGFGLVQLQDGHRFVIGAGETIGELGLIADRSRAETVLAGPDGVRALTIRREIFEELLSTSADFSRDLLTLLAERLRAASQPR